MDFDGFDAVLLLSFGGPEGPEQVMPFLENVTRGRGIPPERLAAVAEHYLHFGGVSPINGINRELIGQLEAELAEPASTCRSTSATATGSPTSRTPLRRCATTGFAARRCSPRRRGAATPAARSTSRTSPAAARRPVSGAPELVKLRQYFDHPLLVEMFAEAIADAAATPARQLRADARLVFTAHSIPVAARSRCGADLYTRQVAYASRLGRGRGGLRRFRPGVAVAVRAAPGAVAGTRCRRPSVGPRRSGHQGRHRLPDRLRRRPHRGGVGSRQRAARTGRPAGIAFARARTPNADRRFARLAVDLIAELRDGTRTGALSRAGCPSAVWLFDRRRAAARRTAGDS